MTSAMHNQVMAPVWEAESAFGAAEKVHKGIPAKIRLGDLNPGRQVLGTEKKLIHHSIHMAAYNTAMTIAREIRTNTGYKREPGSTRAHASSFQPDRRHQHHQTRHPDNPARSAPHPIQTAAIAGLCQHLTSTQTLYPGTELILRYAIK